MYPVPPKIPLEATQEAYRGFYRSSDESIFGGVCAGLSHKTKLIRLGVRVGFALLGLFFLIGPILYVTLWLSLPKLPTRYMPRAKHL